MAFAIIIYAAFGILFISFIVSGVKKIKEIKNSQTLSDLYVDEKAHDEAIKQSGEFELNYFERVRNGEQTQQFLAIAGQPASAMIRSLLCAAGIPSFAENEHINAMYSLNNLSTSSAFAIKVFILVADYDKAYEIVNDFVSSCERANVKENEESKETKESEEPAKIVKKAAGTAGAAVTGFFFIPMPDGSQDKPMGITILPKI